MGLASFQTVKVEDIMPHVLAFVEEAKRLEDVMGIVLFGSMARDEMTNASDIDLAIILATRDHLREIKEKLRAIKLKTLPWPADLVVVDQDWFNSRKNFGGICLAIHQEGKILFHKANKEGMA